MLLIRNKGDLTRTGPSYTKISVIAVALKVHFNVLSYLQLF